MLLEKGASFTSRFEVTYISDKGVDSERQGLGIKCKNGTEAGWAEFGRDLDEEEPYEHVFG